MLRQSLKYLLVAAILSMAPAAVSAAPKWESVKSERADAKSVVKDTELEIKTASSTIIVTTNHSVQIKVFTILGRLVSSETLQPGTSQIQLPAHGVYIVKAAGLTCKVAI